MPQVESSINPVKRPNWSTVAVLGLIIIIGVMVGLLILKLNREQQLKAQISGLQLELTQRPPPTSNNPASPAGGQLSTTNSQPINSSSSSGSSSPSSPPSWADSPSHPAQTHKVEKGETLFAIGQKYSVEWTSIVKANGLADENLIKAGDVLVIPTLDAKAGINQVDFTVDAEQAKAIQATANAQSSTANWRLDPVEVAKKEGSGVYGLTVNDTWVLGNKNSDEGKATVRVAHDGQQYEVNLTQPVDKGEQGIWAVTSVRLIK